MSRSRTAAVLITALLACAALSQAAAQSSVGFSIAGAYASRSLNENPADPLNSVDVIKDRTSGRVLPSVAVSYERQLTRLFALDVQLRYHTSGFRYAFFSEQPIDPNLPVTGTDIDPETGGVTASIGAEEALFRYDFISIPIGASETWGSGSWRYYIEEFIVPQFYLATVRDPTRALPTIDPMRTRTKDERTRDFHLAVRAGIGVERMLNDILRLRLGVAGQYTFTNTLKDSPLRDHLYSVGPEVSIARVFGSKATPGGDPDEIYY